MFRLVSRDEAWRAYGEAYDIDVPQEAIENELDYIRLDMKHRMQYARLAGGEAYPFPDQELADREGELRAVALFEAKAPRVAKAIIAEQGFEVSPEELEAEAQAVAERQGATMDMMRQFFGNDFSALAHDVLEREAVDWACAQQA